MVLSPGADRASAAGACFLCRLPTLPSAYFFAPYPPDPLPRRGRGRFFCFLMQGAAPLASPGLNPGGTGAGGESRAGGGACAGVARSTCRRCPRRESCPPALPARPAAVPGGGRAGKYAKGGGGRRQRGKTSPRSRALQKNFQKPLTEAAQYDIIAKRCQDSGKGHGGVAQLARATGSYPVGHRFKSGLRYHIGQGSAVPYPSGTALVRGFPPGPLVKRPKTPPFHGGNSSSNLLRVTK